AGQWLGIRTRPRVHGKRFDRMVYGLLALSAVSVSWSGFFG
ncbi:MAG: sulfite exporter TauE/SafE family protein, partial [Actinobacteria bacterium]|nr:sulfite exporter TauE/SafE family protein [Actinomycetota bacterium]